MKIPVRYPVILFENRTIDITHAEFLKIRQMSSSEQAFWVWNKIKEIDIDSDIAGLETVKSAFSVGLGEIGKVKA